MASHSAMNSGYMQQSTVFSPEKMSQPPDPYGSGMMGQFQQPFILHANGSVAKPKYASMEAARIDTALQRKKCNPIFLQLCLLLAIPCESGHQIQFRDRGYTAKSDDFLYVKPPSPQGVCFLTGFDYANTGMDAAHSMAVAIRYRWNTDPDLGMTGLPVHDWQAQITPTFVKRAYSISMWSMRSDRPPPLATEDKHSLLNFLPLIDPSYSSTGIPSGGIPLMKMLQLTRFIYFFYSMPSCKRGQPGVGPAYDDRNFRSSVFGSVLRIMCRVLMNHELMQPWAQNQEQCTVAFITDLSELFEMMAEFVGHRAGEDPVLCGIDDGAFVRKQMQLIVAPAVMTTHHITGLPNHLIQKTQEYQRRMDRTWVRQKFVAHQGTSWSSPASTWLLQRASNNGSQAEDGSAPFERDPAWKGKAKKQDGKPKTTSGTPFENSSPMFEYVGKSEFSEAGPMVTHLIDHVVKRGDWPTVSLGEKKATLCIPSSFKGFCKCPNPESCRTPKLFKGFAKNRLHVDLSDDKWSSTKFEESKWDSVVGFLKTYHKVIKPTEALKKLTPSANWPQ